MAGYPTTFPTGTGGSSSPTGSTGSGNIWSLISGGLGWAKDAWSNKKRKELEELRRKYDLEQWHRSNLYNHPLSQIERLREAGLNPNLIYGSSPGSAVGNAGAIPAGQAPEYKLSNPMTPFMNTRVQQAQSNNLRADVLLKGTQSLKTANEAGIKGRELDIINETYKELIGTQKLDYAIKSIQYDVAKGLAPYQIANMQSTAKKNQLAALLLQKDLEYAQSGYPKGNTIGTIMKGVFNLDMSNPTDRKTAQAIVATVMGSQVIGSFTSAFRNILQAFAKKPPTTILNLNK